MTAPRAGAARHVLAAVAVVILVLVLLLAALVLLSGEAPGGTYRGGARATTGGDGAAHVLGKEIARHFAELPPPVGQAPREFTEPYPRQTLGYTGGRRATGPSRHKDAEQFEFEKLGEKPQSLRRGKAKKPPPKRAWTEYSTWEELGRDAGATSEYFRDVFKALSRLDLDWSHVRAELSDIVYDNREWIGRVNYVDGQLRIVEKRPSPLAVGEVGDSRTAAAMVPGELVDKVARTPALFLFHTHPGLATGSAMPSAADVLVATYMAYNSRFAANLVVSPYGVFLYRPDPQFMKAIAESDDPRLAVLRRAADTAAAISGARSWVDPWNLKDYTAQLRRYGIELVVFPTDKYAGISTRADISMPDFAHDFDEIQTLYKRVAEREAELEAAQVPKGLRPK